LVKRPRAHEPLIQEPIRPRAKLLAIALAFFIVKLAKSKNTLKVSISQNQSKKPTKKLKT
jgi:hypothetical protein